MSINDNIKNADITTINNNYLTAFKAILQSRGINSETITIIANAENARMNAQTTAMINTLYDTISSQLLQSQTSIINNLNNKYYHRVSLTGLVDGTNKNFTLAYPLSVDSENIWISRVFMQNENNEDYILNGINLSFVTAPQLDDKIIIKGNY